MSHVYSALMLAVLLTALPSEPRRVRQHDLWCRPQLNEIDRLQKMRNFDRANPAHDERITDLQMLIVHELLPDGRMF